MQARARDLFYALWINDLFMQRVEANAQWSLFCPNEAPGLADVWGEEFEALYTKYEKAGRAKKTVKAQQLWFAILEAQVGGPTSACCCSCLPGSLIPSLSPHNCIIDTHAAGQDEACLACIHGLYTVLAVHGCIIAELKQGSPA